MALLKKHRNAFFLASLLVFPFILFSKSAHAELSAQAMATTLFNRIAGAPLLLDDPRRAEMEDLISRGRIEEAAALATADPRFISTTIRSMATPLSNTDETGVRVLTDFVVTFMLAIDNDRPLTDLMQADMAYTANPALLPYATKPEHNPSNPGYKDYLAKISFYHDRHYTQAITVSIPIASPSIATSENFYPIPRVVTLNPGTPSQSYMAEQTLEPVGWALVGNTVLPHFVEIGQNQKTDVNDDNVVDNILRISNEDIAGLLSTRDFVSQAVSGGTNRRAIKWVFERFLCTNLEEVKDPLADSRYVRRDVDRAPGGDPNAYVSCNGCHANLDPMSHATAYFLTTGGRTRYSRSVQGQVKFGSVFENSSTYAQGFVPTDNTWTVVSRNSSAHARLGWRGATSGRGLKSLGKMFANSRAFSRCMSKHVFRHVCRRDEENFEAEVIEEMADFLEANNYNMRRLFEKASTIDNCFER